MSNLPDRVRTIKVRKRGNTPKKNSVVPNRPNQFDYGLARMKSRKYMMTNNNEHSPPAENYLKEYPGYPRKIA